MVRTEFAYHQSLGPILGVLLGIAVVEMLVVHLVVVTLFGWTAAVIAGVLDVSLVIVLIAVLRSFRRLPVTIADDVLTMRAGILKSISVRMDNVAGLRLTWDRAALRDPNVLNLALASWPNVVVDLNEPVPMRNGRPILAIAHKVDDPLAFREAIGALARVNR